MHIELNAGNHSLSFHRCNMPDANRGLILHIIQSYCCLPLLLLLGSCSAAGQTGDGTGGVCTETIAAAATGAFDRPEVIQDLYGGGFDVTDTAGAGSVMILGQHNCTYSTCLHTTFRIVHLPA